MLSTNAGIPDFRSPSFGLYERLEKYNLQHPTDVFNIDFFKVIISLFKYITKNIANIFV